MQGRSPGRNRRICDDGTQRSFSVYAQGMVRLGIVGLGNMGSGHVASMHRIKRCELTAVCDTVPEKLARYSDFKTFSDSSEMIRSGDIDAILLAVPHYDHTTIGIEAMQHGIHVLTEKPISVHKADCERLIAAHTDPKVVFAAMFNQRTDPFYKRIRSVVKNGESRAKFDAPRASRRTGSARAAYSMRPVAGGRLGLERAAACY